MVAAPVAPEVRAVLVAPAADPVVLVGVPVAPADPVVARAVLVLAVVMPERADRLPGDPMAVLELGLAAAPVVAVAVAVLRRSP